MKNRLFYFLLFICLATIGNAQLVTETIPKSQLNLDLDALSLDVGYAFKLEKKLMLGIGVGIGLGYNKLFFTKQPDRLFDLLHARLFISNHQVKKGFSWESGIMGSIVGISDSKAGFVGNLYFRPYFGNEKWKIGTQLGFGFNSGGNDLLWTPLIVRYTIYYPKTK